MKVNEFIKIMSQDEEFKQWLNEHPEVKKQIEKLELSNILQQLEIKQFVLQEIYWKGQKVVRDVPKRQFVLRIGNSNKFDSYLLSDNPIIFYPVGCVKDTNVDKKFWNYEGELQPQTKYNPNEKLIAYMKILDTGKVDVTKTNSNPDTFELMFRGKKLKGHWILQQEGKNSYSYSLYFRTEEEALSEFKFKLYRENLIEIQLSTNECLRIRTEQSPIHLKVAEFVPAIVKITECKSTGNPIDVGSVEILNIEDDFASFVFKGHQLKGYFVLKDQNNRRVFGKSDMPKVLSIEPYEEPRVEKHKDYIMIYLYDLKRFHKCEDWQKYLDLNLPKEILDIGVCSYTVAGTLPHLKVVWIKMIADETKVNSVLNWIKQNELAKLDFVQKRMSNI